MPEKSIDRRVRRTRSALQNALISLILEKGYDTVTIEEITERADLGRTTFYLHFRAKEELLLHAIDTICEDFLEKNRALMALVDITKGSLQPSSLILDEGPLFQIFAHARENADLYKVMMRGEGGAMASQRFGNIIKEEVVKRLSQVKKLAIKVPLEVFAIYFSKTLMGLVTWWLENNQPYPIEIMVQYFQQMFFLGAINTLNIPHEKLQIDLVN